MSTITRHNITDVPGCFVVKGLLSSDECTEWAQLVREVHHQKETCQNTSSKQQQPRRESQHHLPLKVNSGHAGFASLTQRLRPFLPNVAGPNCKAHLDISGQEISTFLRCYRYLPGDRSAPHFDRSFAEHSASKAKGSSRGGSPVRFSAYSVVVYLNDDFEGGETTFFRPLPSHMISRRGLSPKEGYDQSILEVAAKVVPRKGDVLVFPHGWTSGCHPNPLHEGSTVVSGEKCILRTDVVYKNPMRTPRNQTVKDRSSINSSLNQNLTAAVVRALQGITTLEQATTAAVDCFRKARRADAGDLECTAALNLFWSLAREQRDTTKGGGAGETTVTVTSAMGLERQFDRRSLAHDLAHSLVECADAVKGDGDGAGIAAVHVAPGPSGTLVITLRDRLQMEARNGRVPCTACGKFVRAAGDGLQWHLKTAHGIDDHADACTMAEAQRLAIVPRAPAQSLSHADAHAATATGEPAQTTYGARLSPADMSTAQRSAPALQRMVAEGRVKSLGAGLDACRCGDLDALRSMVRGSGWDPRGVRDANGSGALLWAAGGGHLAVCRFLVDECGVDVHATADAGARRGYVGRSALHWAARNGHLAVVRWLVEEHNADVDSGTVDGTTAFCWAAWQGHLPICRFLHADAGCSPHAGNLYGCNAALWAAQGGASLAMCRYLRSLGVAWDTINANGQGPVHKAAQRGCRHICEWLLSDEGGLRTAVHLAPNAAEQSTPAALARMAGHGDLAQWLQEHEDWLRDSSTDTTTPAQPIIGADDASLAVSKTEGGDAASSIPVLSKRKARALAKKQEKRLKRDVYKAGKESGRKETDTCTTIPANDVSPSANTAQCDAVDMAGRDTKQMVSDAWEALFRDGYCVVRSGLPHGAAQAFYQQIAHEMEHPLIPQQQCAHVQLRNPATWPRGGTRRVAECVPAGVGAHWATVAGEGTPVAAVLDELMGKGCWELPHNPPACADSNGLAVRHWYAPVVFPEHHPDDDAVDGDKVLAALRKDAATWAPLPPDATEPAWTPADDALLVQLFRKAGAKWRWIAQQFGGERSKAHVRFRAAFLLLHNAATAAAAGPTASISWRAVNRRRVHDKGWHLDIGPGFDTDALRTLAGHRFQGCIVLVLLSDCPAGHGGTAVIPGSQHWVRDHLARHTSADGLLGVPHQKLNAWAVAEVATRLASGTLRMAYDAETPTATHVVEQMVGSAGDVWLLHPWLVHSGTTNYGTRPRVMANGMVRIREEHWPVQGSKLLTDDARRCTVARLPPRPPADGALPCVSVIVPVHNGLRLIEAGGLTTWLDACMQSVMAQTYTGPIEVSIFDDASDDGTDRAIATWQAALVAAGIAVVAHGSRWGVSHGAAVAAVGIGGAKNRAVQQSTGAFLCFLDVDDEMLPRRIELQLQACQENPFAIVGSSFVRIPKGATEHYADWANSMTEEQLWLEQFRENTVLSKF